MFQPPYPFASGRLRSRQLKHENTTFPQVMQGLSAFRIRALTHHDTTYFHLRFPGRAEDFR